MPRICAVVLLIASISSAFVVTPQPRCAQGIARRAEDTVGKDLKRKLLQEAASPWRGVRVFFYGAFAFSASVGLVTALAQLAASSANQPDSLPLSQSGLNVAVDLGVVGLCFLGYRIDSRAAVDVVSEQPTSALSEDQAAERSETLSSLRVTVGTDEANGRVASLRTLRLKAGQNIVVLGGQANQVDDALTDALIQQKLLAKAECVVVPVRTNALSEKSGDAAASPKKIDRAGFVATPADEDREAWLDYVREEMATAEEQGADAREGVVIAVRKDGTVARRGVGKPPWKVVIDELST